MTSEQSVKQWLDEMERSRPSDVSADDLYAAYLRWCESCLFTKKVSEMKISKEQQRIASNCVADAVRDAVSGRERPSAEELVKLAEETAKAVLAGLKALSEES